MREPNKLAELYVMETEDTKVDFERGYFPKDWHGMCLLNSSESPSLHQIWLLTCLRPS
jgi:hypothetical protein